VADSIVGGNEFSSHKIPEFSWKVEPLLASLGKFSFAELVFFFQLLQNQICFLTQTNLGMSKKSTKFI
jgi:hypothetical protein